MLLLLSYRRVDNQCRLPKGCDDRSAALPEL